MKINSFTYSTDFYTNPEARELAPILAQWCADAFFPSSQVSATAEVVGRGVEKYPAVYVGFFSPDVVVAPKEADKRLYIQIPGAMPRTKTLIRAFRDACEIVWSNPRYVVSPAQRDGKWNEMLANWMNSENDDTLFAVDMDHYYFPSTRPVPWPGPGNFPWENWLVYFRLGNPLVDQRMFSIFQKRRARIFGRSDRPAWRDIHAAAKAGIKFKRNKEKLIASPNDNGFGNDGTRDWKEGIRDAAKRVAVDAAKAAVNSATKGIADAAAKKAGARIKKKAAAALKELLRKR